MAKILVADDSPTEARIFELALMEKGHEVIVAHDGEEGERRALEENPDLLVLDIMMPRKNGFQVCRDLKSRPETKHIPIIIVTSKGAEADIFWGRKQGADEYLVKPFKPQVLAETVDRLLAR